MTATTGRARFLDGPLDPLPPSLSGQPDANGETIIASLPAGNYAFRASPNGVQIVRRAAPAGADEQAALREINRRNRQLHGLPPGGM